MSEIKFALCLPSITVRPYKGGGHLNTVRFANLLAEHAEVQLISYREREDSVWYLPDVADKLVKDKYVLLLTWGPDVQAHLRQFHGLLPIVYYQQSMDNGIVVPPDVPVISMSKYMMAYSQLTWPASPQFYIPPVLEANCRNFQRERDIDVLLLKRKQPRYVLEELISLLEGRCRVLVLDEFVTREELFALFNRAKVYLYAFAPQRTPYTITGWRYMEGIATQTLEAMACGCTICSDVRGGHVDFVEPFVHGYRITAHSPGWDAHQILNAVRDYPQQGQSDYEQYMLGHYGEEAFHVRAEALLKGLSEYLSYSANNPAHPESFGIPAPISRPQKMQELVIGKLYRWKRDVTRKWRQRSGTDG